MRMDCRTAQSEHVLPTAVKTAIFSTLLDFKASAMTSPFAQPAMASLGPILNTTIEWPTMRTRIVDAIRDSRVLVTLLVLWTLYCLCGAVYRRMTVSQIKA